MRVSCPRCGEPSLPGEACKVCLMKVAIDDLGSPDAEIEALQGIRGLEIQELLGKGGMGRVYRAAQKDLGRTVALKILPEGLASDPEFVERFKREARVLASLDHPNIVDVHDFGVEKGYSFLVMEYVEGVNLRELMKRGLKPEQALAIVPQICEALEYSHRRGVVHRDIKPENILIDTRGQVKIADFGLAKLCEREDRHLTGTRDVMGTPHYMAPEQQEGMDRVDHRADIYSLGVVFYEMLTGALPIGYFPPPSRRADVDARLDPIVLKALQNRPDRRYQQAGEMKADVETVKMAPAPPRQGTKIRIVVGTAVLGSLVAYLLVEYWIGPWIAPPGDPQRDRILRHMLEGGHSPPSPWRALYPVVAFGVLAALIVAFWCWMLVDCLLRDHRSVRMFGATGEYDKIVWLILFFVVNVPAAILYFFLVKRRVPRTEARA